jgi:hypothetical protein
MNSNSAKVFPYVRYLRDRESRIVTVKIALPWRVGEDFETEMLIEGPVLHRSGRANGIDELQCLQHAMNGLRQMLKPYKSDLILCSSDGADLGSGFGDLGFPLLVNHYDIDFANRLELMVEQEQARYDLALRQCFDGQDSRSSQQIFEDLSVTSGAKSRQVMIAELVRRGGVEEKRIAEAFAVSEDAKKVNAGLAYLDAAAKK